MTTKPTIAVWKFASCDGCQLSLLDCEDELLQLTGVVELAYFPEATRDMKPGPYDVSIIEGSITTRHDAERLLKIREESGFVLTIGACATAGGIQSLRNFQNIESMINAVYAHPEYIKTLATSTPISDHIRVDYELRGCPINKYQLLEILTALVQNRRPNIPNESVCIGCKQRGTVCIMVSQGIPCLGPLTHAGCDAICPSYNRGCYGCYGPKENVNPASLGAKLQENDLNSDDWVRMLRTFNANAEPFKKECERHEKK